MLELWEPSHPRLHYQLLGSHYAHARQHLEMPLNDVQIAWQAMLSETHRAALLLAVELHWAQPSCVEMHLSAALQCQLGLPLLLAMHLRGAQQLSLEHRLSVVVMLRREAHPQSSIIWLRHRWVHMEALPACVLHPNL